MEKPLDTSGKVNCDKRFDDCRSKTKINRDSGYVGSPANLQPLHFTFDLTPPHEADLPGAVGGREAGGGGGGSPSSSSSSPSSSSSLSPRRPSSDCKDDDEDDNNNEVFEGGDEFGGGHAASAPVPIPGSVAGRSRGSDDDGLGVSLAVSPSYGVYGKTSLLSLNLRRTIGTQTPSLDRRGGPAGCGRSEPRWTVSSERGIGIPRVRFYSEGEDTESSESRQSLDPLPDLVPVSRDRSISLPEVAVYGRRQSQEVGRELRRISDEYYNSHTTRHRIRGAFSFPRDPMRRSLSFLMEFIFGSSLPATLPQEDSSDQPP